MSRQSFAKTISDSQLLVEALERRNNDLPVGVTAEARDRLKTLNESTLKTNAEQEKLKAELKEKTAQLDQQVSEIETLKSTIKKYIKIAVPQELWREFGIEDKR